MLQRDLFHVIDWCATESPLSRVPEIAMLLRNRDFDVSSDVRLAMKNRHPPQSEICLRSTYATLDQKQSLGIAADQTKQTCASSEIRHISLVNTPLRRISWSTAPPTGFCYLDHLLLSLLANKHYRIYMKLAASIALILLPVNICPWPRTEASKMHSPLFFPLTITDSTEGTEQGRRERLSMLCGQVQQRLPFIQRGFQFERWSSREGALASWCHFINNLWWLTRD